VSYATRRRWSFVAPRAIFFLKDWPQRAPLQKVRTLAPEKRNWGDEVEVIFLHIPKTGGSSLGQALKIRYGDGYIVINSVVEVLEHLESGRSAPRAIRLNHLPPLALVQSGILDASLLEDSKLVSIIRDPRARFLSAFYYASERGWLPPKTSQLDVLAALNKPRWQPLGPRLSKSTGLAFFRPQTSFFAGVNPSKITLYRFDDFFKSSGERGLEIREKLNSGFYPKGGPTLSEEAAELLCEVYAQDYDLWSRLSSS
jgi:hypothetical protein